MEGCDFFAVYDGHSGAEVANQCKSMLYAKIRDAILALGPDALTRKEEIVGVLKTIFIEHNKYLASKIDSLNDSGSTATVALVTSTHIFMAYLGDSPCFIMNPQTGLILEEMGKHEPSLAVETARIQAAGGFVEIDEYGIPRVDGLLAVSRAFGDFSLNWKGKVPPAGADWTRMKVTADPDVMVWDRPEVGVLAIMSDGLVETDSATLKPLPEIAHDIQKNLIHTSYDLKKTSERTVVEHARHSANGRRYSGDDLSIILIDVGTGTMMGGAVQSYVKPQKPPTRKSKGRRRIRTEKQSRLIKIFSC
jgi:serine/threonine protein phosphatase PrpC